MTSGYSAEVGTKLHEAIYAEIRYSTGYHSANANGVLDQWLDIEPFVSGFINGLTGVFYAEIPFLTFNIANYYTGKLGDTGEALSEFSKHASDVVLGGTIDLLVVERGSNPRLRVFDWKTGTGDLGDPVGSYQLMVAAHAAMADKGFTRCDVGFVYTDSKEICQATVSLEEAEAMVMSAERWTKKNFASTGSHCLYCKNKTSCSEFLTTTEYFSGLLEVYEES